MSLNNLTFLRNIARGPVTLGLTPSLDWPWMMTEPPLCTEIGMYLCPSPPWMAAEIPMLIQPVTNLVANSTYLLCWWPLVRHQPTWANSDRDGWWGFSWLEIPMNFLEEREAPGCHRRQVAWLLRRWEEPGGHCRFPSTRGSTSSIPGFREFAPRSVLDFSYNKTQGLSVKLTNCKFLMVPRESLSKVLMTITSMTL